MNYYLVIGLRADIPQFDGIGFLLRRIPTYINIQINTD